MKSTRIILAGLTAALLCGSCAKSTPSGLNDSAKRYFDAWISVHYPNVEKTFPGIYIIQDTPGNMGYLPGVADCPYIYIDYEIKDLNGNITSTTNPETAKQLGSYSDSFYYGPEVVSRNYSSVNAGLEAMLSTMKVGGERTAVIPGWLTCSSRYDKEEDYLKKESGENVIYNIKLRDGITDIAKWQIDSIERYMTRLHMPADSLVYGFYYIQTQAPEDTTTLGTGVELNINYTGSLLNGKVFDTTDKKIAKDHGIYSASKSYEPMVINISENNDNGYNDVSMTSGSSNSDVIEGFARALGKMKKGEKGIAIFYSNMGYKDQASSNIPAFSPLRFDLEMIGLK